jgi:hypothetical protein
MQWSLSAGIPSPKKEKGFGLSGAEAPMFDRNAALRQHPGEIQDFVVIGAWC